jgi:peptide/nickel transport system substrate-binding protein
VIDRVITRGDYQMTQFGAAAPADPALFLDRYFKTKGTTNVMGYSNKELDGILTEAGAETDDAKRKELYDKALAIIVEDAPVYVWSQLALNTVHQANTSDFGIKGNYTFDWASMTKA